jgi:hypothetical protein
LKRGPTASRKPGGNGALGACGKAAGSASSPSAHANRAAQYRGAGRRAGLAAAADDALPSHPRAGAGGGGGGAHKYSRLGPALMAGHAAAVHHCATAAVSREAASKPSTASRATHSSASPPGGHATAVSSSPWPRVARGEQAAARAAASGGEGACRGRRVAGRGLRNGGGGGVGYGWARLPAHRFAAT